MVANLATTADGRAATFYTGERPWHGLGTELDHPATAHEAIAAAGLDFDVELVPLVSAAGGVEVFGHKGVLRADKNDIIGVVGDRYTPIQNREAFGFFDAVVGAGQAIYHTAGALGRGERVWILAKLPGEVRVNGHDDTLEKFLLLSNTHDGSSTLRLFFTPVRVVCQNTLNIALSGGAHEGVSIRHTGNLKAKVSQAQHVLGLATKFYDDLGAIITRLSEVPLGAASVRDYFKTVVPDNAKAENKARTENIRVELTDLFERGRGADLAGARGTLWGAVNAVTEFADHHRSTRGANEAEKRSSRLQSLWFGSGAQLKGRAWSEALELANISQ